MSSVQWPTLLDLPNPVRDSVAVSLPLIVAFAAAAYGGVEPWSELALIVIVGVSLLPVLVTGVQGGLSRSAIGGALALLSFAILATIQAIELPLSVVEWLSPARAASAKRLLPSALSSLGLSYCTEATWHSLRHVLIAGTVFLAVAVSVRSIEVAKRLLVGLFAVGVAESVLSLAQQATRADGIYWGTVALGGVRSGSFINHSNFSQFLNLTIGAGLALLFVRMSEDRGRERQRRYARSARKLFRRHGWLLIGLALQGGAIAASHSRAGVLATLVSFVVVFLLLARRRTMGRSAWALLAIPPVVFCALTLIGFDSFFGRVDTLGSRSSYTDRIELTKATLRVGAEHPILGTGLGSHAFVFPGYDTTESIAAAEQADNDYAQLVEETGVFGCVLLLAFAVITGRSLYRATGRKHYSLGYAGYGIGFGLLAIAIQSATDFGQRVPAVYCVTAGLCGLAVAIGRKQPIDPPANVMTSAWSLRGIATGIAFLGLFSFAAVAATQDYRADRWWAIAYEIENKVRTSEPQSVELADYVDLVAASEQACRLDPSNVEYRFWLNAYRWQALLIAAGASDSDWSVNYRESAARIIEELQSARRLCPTYGPLSTLEGQVRLSVGDEAGVHLINQGVELTPNDPLVCLAAGAVALQSATDSGDDRAAYDLLARAVRLDDRLFAEAAAVVLDTRGDIEEAAVLTLDDASRLRSLADMVAARSLSADSSDSLRRRADVIQRELVEAGSASPRDVADLARRTAASGDLEGAVLLYRRALAARFNQVEWRVSLVDTLTRLKRFDEAHHEARICLRIQPNSQAAKKRFEALSNRLLDD